MKIAVCLFAYNRPDYLRKAIKTHIKLPDMSYYAFVDKSDKQKEIVDIIHDSHLYDVVIPRRDHLGLNVNIRDGIDWVLQSHDAVIVLEDDLLLSNDALWWLTSGLEWEDTVSCDKGDGEFKCWAWAMKKNIWDRIDWDLRPDKKHRDSWDVIVAENFRVNNWFCLSSPNPRVKHIGWSGIHYKQLDRFSIRRLLRKLF